MPDRLECSKSTNISDFGFSSPENNEVKSAAHSEKMWTTLLWGVRPGNTPPKSPFRFHFPGFSRREIGINSESFPGIFQKISKKTPPQIVSRYFPIGLQWPLSKTHVVSRFFPKKNFEIFYPNLFPGFSRSVYSDHFKKLMSFPGFSWKKISPKSFPGFSRSV